MAGSGPIKPKVTEAQAVAARVRDAWRRRDETDDDATAEAANTEANNALGHLDVLNQEIYQRTGSSVDISGLIVEGWNREVAATGGASTGQSDEATARVMQGGLLNTIDLDDVTVLARHEEALKKGLEEQRRQLIEEEAGRPASELTEQQRRNALREAGLRAAGVKELEDSRSSDNDIDTSDEDRADDLREVAHRLEVAAVLGKDVHDVKPSDEAAFQRAKDDAEVEARTGKPADQATPFQRAQQLSAARNEAYFSRVEQAKQPKEPDSTESDPAAEGEGTTSSGTVAGVGNGTEGDHAQGARPGAGLGNQPDDAATGTTSGTATSDGSNSPAPSGSNATDGGSVPPGSKAYSETTHTYRRGQDGTYTGYDSTETVYRTPDGSWVDSNGEPLPTDDAAQWEDQYQRLGDGTRNGNRDPSNDVPGAPPAGEAEDDPDSQQGGDSNDDTSDDDTSDDDSSNDDNADDRADDDSTTDEQTDNGDDSDSSDSDDSGADDSDTTPNPENDFGSDLGRAAFESTPLGQAQAERERKHIADQKSGGVTDPTEEDNDVHHVTGDDVNAPGGDVDPFDGDFISRPSIEQLDVLKATGGGAIGPRDSSAPAAPQPVGSPVGGPPPINTGGGTHLADDLQFGKGALAAAAPIAAAATGSVSDNDVADDNADVGFGHGAAGKAGLDDDSFDSGFLSDADDDSNDDGNDDSGTDASPHGVGHTSGLIGHTALAGRHFASLDLDVDLDVGDLADGDLDD